MISYNTASKSFTWANTVVSEEIFNKIKSEYKRGILAHERKYNYVNSLYNETGNKTCITEAQFSSIKNSLGLTEIFHESQTVHECAAEIMEQYNYGCTINSISRTFLISRFSLLQFILTKIYGHKIADYVFQRRENATHYLKERELDEYKRIARHDVDRILSCDEIAKDACAKENAFIKYFRNCPGVSFRTESEIGKEQIELFGRPVATPDIVFNEPIIINGQKIAWMEFKNYTGIPYGILYKKNKKQINRYIEIWGAGAICFNGAFVNNTHFNCMILDATALNL